MSCYFLKAINTVHSIKKELITLFSRKQQILTSSVTVEIDGKSFFRRENSLPFLLRLPTFYSLFVLFIRI